MEDGFASTVSLKPNMGNQIGKRCCKPLACTSCCRRSSFSICWTLQVCNKLPSIMPCWNGPKAAAGLVEAPKGMMALSPGLEVRPKTAGPRMGGTTMPRGRCNWKLSCCMLNGGGFEGGCGMLPWLQGGKMDSAICIALAK